MHNSVSRTGDTLTINDKKFHLSSYKDIYLIGKLLAKRVELIVITRAVFLHLLKVHQIERSKFKIHPLNVNQENLYLAFSKMVPLSKTLAGIFAVQLKAVQNETERPSP